MTNDEADRRTDATLVTVSEVIGRRIGVALQVVLIDGVTSQIDDVHAHVIDPVVTTEVALGLMTEPEGVNFKNCPIEFFIDRTIKFCGTRHV